MWFTVTENSDIIVEHKLQKRRTGHFAEKDSKNRPLHCTKRSRPKHARTDENVTAVDELL